MTELYELYLQSAWQTLQMVSVAALVSALFGLVLALLPNTVPTLIVVATTGVAGAILNESYLSYLGLGVVPPTPSWGNMMDTANSFVDFQRRPWLWMPPGLAIFATVIAINVLGDGLRDALDPRLQARGAR